jgi:flagellar basal-body rod protein FlgB
VNGAGESPAFLPQVHGSARAERLGTVLATWRGTGAIRPKGTAEAQPYAEGCTVNELSDAAVMASLHRQLTFAAAKQVVASSNLANINTPGYKAKAASFSDSLARQINGGPGLTTTNAHHIGGGSDLSLSTTQDVEGLPARRDGNTVQIDRELVNMTDAAQEFARAQTALAAKFRLVRYAIGEGK